MLVLGGYGNFGSRICRALTQDPRIQLIVAGRNPDKARAFAAELQPMARGGVVEAAAVDHVSPDLDAALARLRLDLAIHTGGPYQGQGYHVAEACIRAGVHYIDLADGREFVTGISALDGPAKERGVLVVSGASTVPALSSAVIDSLMPEFSVLESIETSIAPGQRMPRGLATLQAVLSYCGKPFESLRAGQWVKVFGWQQMVRHTYPDLGTRWMSPCDVPDLVLFPRRYPGVTTVSFYAALELKAMQLGLALLAHLRCMGLVADWSPHAAWLKRCSDLWDFLGSDAGGMHLTLVGRGLDGQPARRTWNLLARRGHGPEIPCIAAIVLARKLAAGQITERGAMPCMGLMSLDDFAGAVSHLDIRWSLAAPA